MKAITRSCLVVGALFGFSAQSYIYEIRVMRRWNHYLNEYQYFIGCSDYHDKSHAANGWQRKGIKEIFKESNKKEILVLLEDLSSPNPSGQSSCGQFFLSSDKGILASLTKECQQMGVDTRNLEYRYCRVIGLCGILSDISKNPYQSQPACTIRISTLLDEIQRTLDEIAGYRDGPLLSFLYGQECSKVRSWIYRLQLNLEKESSIARLCNKSTTIANRSAWIKRLLTFDSCLLDCKLVHDLVNATTKSRVVAVAGGTHIERVCDMLSKIGFRSVDRACTGSQGYKGIQQAVGLCVEAREGAKPKSVGLELLRRYVMEK